MSEPNGRGHERTPASIDVELVVSLHGFDPLDHGFEAHGTTVDVSRGGALTRVRRPVTEGSRCVLHVPGGEEALGRNLIYGTVRRVTEEPEGFLVAVEFDTPLEGLDLDEGDASHEHAASREEDASHEQHRSHEQDEPHASHEQDEAQEQDEEKA